MVPKLLAIRKKFVVIDMSYDTPPLSRGIMLRVNDICDVRPSHTPMCGVASIRLIRSATPIFSFLKNYYPYLVRREKKGIYANVLVILVLLML
jgi:hypothetical protein